MPQLTVSILIAITSITVAACQVQLPCESPLRQFPQLARFFEHCICNYLPWTAMTPLQNATPFAMPFILCKSQAAIRAERWQIAISGYECNGTVCEECQDKREEGYVCDSNCRYSNWTHDMIPYVNATPVTVPRNHCKSELALFGERRQTAISGYECNGTVCKECQDKRKEGFLCISNCHYSNWTNIIPYVNGTSEMVPRNQCRSELALFGERWQMAISGYECDGTVCKECQDKQEEGYTCINTCQYSEWTDVAPNVSARHVAVPESQCKSRFALQGVRWQHTLRGYECNGTLCRKCQDKREERYVCEPTITERLVTMFELGRSGQNHYEDRFNFPTDNIFNSINRSVRASTNNNYLTPAEMCDATQVCYRSQGKRQSYTFVDEQPHINTQNPTSEPELLPIDPVPFNLFKHGGRYRRQSNVMCHPDDTRYVLFILDTSGSIGHYNFQRITSTLSTLVHHFCRHTKVAVFTFSGDHFIEFCFDCFGNDCAGRDSARNAMAGINYRGGSTRTGQATQCVCNNVLTPSCGFPELPTVDTTCLDVVYVTDGHSNGPIDVGQSVQCLYDLERCGVELNVFAFGIGGYDITELKCITRDRSLNYVENKVFEVDSFDEFEDAINNIVMVFGLPPVYSAGFGDITPDCFAIDASDAIGYDDCSSSSSST